MIFKIDLHIHTELSPCSGNSLESIHSVCEAKGLIPAISDHNEIAGALEYREKYGFCIIGEEVATTEGEVIGLNIGKKILPGGSPERTLKEIKKQGGITVVPHPGDRLRRKRLRNVERYADLIDCIEVFNSRTIFRADGKKAEALCRKMGKVAIVGSDAHFKTEISKAYVTVELESEKDMENSEKFLKALMSSKFTTGKSPLYVHALTKLRMLI